MAGDRPIDPPSDPMDSFIEEAEARWDAAMTIYEHWIEAGVHRHRGVVFGMLVEKLSDVGFSRKILEDAIIDQCDKLIQDLAERLYSEANSTNGYD